MADSVQVVSWPVDGHIATCSVYRNVTGRRWHPARKMRPVSEHVNVPRLDNLGKTERCRSFSKSPRTWSRFGDWPSQCSPNCDDEDDKPDKWSTLVAHEKAKSAALRDDRDEVKVLGDDPIDATSRLIKDAERPGPLAARRKQTA